MNTDSESAPKPQYIYLDHLKHENPPILNFSESVEMPIDIPKLSIRDLDRLVSSVPGPSLPYAVDGTGGASSSLGNLVVSLLTVAANEVVEISLPTVASLLPVGNLPTVADETLLVVSLPTVATNEVAEISLPPVASLLPAVSLHTYWVEQQTFTDLMNIHRHYTHRTQEDNDKAIKILLDKINDPEKINWHPRFYKTLAECDITLPLVDLVDFRYVLMNTFQSAHTDIANLKSSLRLIISGSPHSRSTREEERWTSK